MAMLAKSASMPTKQQKSTFELATKMTTSLSPTSDDWLREQPLLLAEDTISSHKSPYNLKDMRSACTLDPISFLRSFDVLSSTPAFHQQQNLVNETVPMKPTRQTASVAIDPVIRKFVVEHANTEQAVSLMIIKVKDEANLNALRQLLELQGNVSAALHVFAQRLLLPAMVDGNISLVEILLEAGVSPNTRAHLFTNTTETIRNTSQLHQEIQQTQIEARIPRMTALQVAVYNRREDMIHLLLRYGATDWRAEFQGANGYITGSILDVIIGMGKQQEWTILDFESIRSISHSILKTTLHFGSSASQPPAMLLRALRHAVLNNRMDMILLLLKYCPSLLETARKTPWLMLEAASTLPDLGIFWFFVHKGFSPNATISSGIGSSMAALASNQNATSLILDFDAAGINLNGMAYGLGPLQERSQERSIAETSLNGVYEMAALHIAVRDGNESLVRLLLYLGADVNQCCHVYPIQLAAWNGHEPIIKMLIGAGADVSAVYQGERCYSFSLPDWDYIFSANITATRIASGRGHLHVVDLIRDSEAQTLSSSLASVQGNGMAILGDAITEANLKLFCRVLDDITLPGGELYPQHGIRALILAVKNDRVNFITKLLLAGANPYGNLDPSFSGLEDFDDRHMLVPWKSPFEGAVSAGALAIIEIFLAQSESLLDEEERLDSKRQISAAFATAMCAGNLELKALLLGHGLDPKDIDAIMGPNYVQQRLHIALQQATEARNFVEAERLLDIGAPPNSPNDNTANTHGMMTPLQYAAKFNSMSILKRLIQAGAAIDTPPQIVEGWTALQLAASNGNQDMVGLLVTSGADTNARPAAYNGRTAMEAAAEHGHKAVVSYLLVHGADLQGQRNTHYRRSLYRAWQNGHHAMVDGLHAWMMEQDGCDGTEPVKEVIESVKEEDLEFIDEEAKMQYEAYLHEYDSASEDGEDEGNGAVAMTDEAKISSFEHAYSATDWSYAGVDLQWGTSASLHSMPQE